MPDLIGQTIGKYRVVARLGQGGMAEVYKAYQPGLDRYVAVKVLHSHLAGDPDFIGRFEREARAVANLRHPNIVQVFDFDSQEQMYYMAMEFVNGPTLKVELQTRVEQGKLFTLEETARIMAALCSAIDYAHTRGMVHRDLKPANFILTQDGQILILDFGIAKIVGATQFTVTGMMSGTPAYMSPEQGQGERGDARSDIYSLGVVLYEMITGKVPFDADTPFAVIMKHINASLPSPRSINPNIPEVVERVILKALSKNPDERYQTGAEFAAALREAVGLSPYDSLAKNPVIPIATIPKVEELKPSDPSFMQAALPQGGRTAVDLKSDTATILSIPKSANKWFAIGGVLIVLFLLAIIAVMIVGMNNRQKEATQTAMARSVQATANAQALLTQTASTQAQVAPSNTPEKEKPNAPSPTPVNTPNLDATIAARLTATGFAVAVETADAVGTQMASQPTNTPTSAPTDTPLPTNTAPPTNTPLPLPPTNTPVPTTPTPTPSPVPVAPKVSGRIAVPVMNWTSGRYDVWFYDAATGDTTAKIEGARQPYFREDGLKILVNGDADTGHDNVWEANGLTGQLERVLSGSPTDSHPVYNPWGSRIAYDNPNLAIGSDGQNHPFIFVQCGLVRPQDEPDEKCRDVARFGVLVPSGQIGEIQGSSPVWTGDDRIAYKGCNTWAGGNSCGIYIVGSWANKKNSNGETPVKIPGIDGTSTTPTDTQGNLFLYHAYTGSDWEVYLSPVGGGPTNLSNSPSSNEGLGAFSPDGKWVAFVSDRGGGWGVWAVPANGGSAVKLFDLPPNPFGNGDYDWTNERISWAQ